MPALKPNPGQQEFSLKQPYNIKEILYGGARGGGKTFAGMIWMTEYIDHPRYQGLVIRRNSDDLSDWIERARFMYKDLGGAITGNPAIIRFPSGAMIRTGHLKDDQTYTKYQGHEYQKMLIEELTQIQSEDRYLKLISSCRTSVPELKPQIFSTANPGGTGHLWVKQRFIDPAPANRAFIAEDGMRRIYIPATIDDNPILKAADPEYVATIEALKYTDEATYRAWRYGDWDIFVGQVFKEWRTTEHVIDKLPVRLSDCTIYIGFDWGYNDPASAHWIAVAPENDYGVRHAYVYREIYANEKTAEWWAKEIADIIKDEPIEACVLPHDAFSRLGGSATIASRFEDQNIPIVNAEAKSHSAKLNRQSLMHDLLSTSPDTTPYIQVLHTCRNLIRTLPALPYSDTKPEEIDDKAEDHAYDSLTYGLFYITHGESWLVNPVLPRDKRRETSVYGLDDGTIVSAGLDIDKLLDDKMYGRDWRSI